MDLAKLSWDWGIVLGVAGLIATIYFGITTISKKISQKQSVRNGGIVIQSGRDTEINKRG